MFRNILDRLKEAGAYLMQSRLVTLIIIFCVSSSILIGRLFYLQIVKGSDYLENYEYSIRRTHPLQQHAEIFMTVMEICWLITSWLIP